MLRGEEFKAYIQKLRGKSSVYKIKKSELNELKSEMGILSRTKEILEGQNGKIEKQLVRKNLRLQ